MRKSYPLAPHIPVHLTTNPPPGVEGILHSLNFKIAIQNVIIFMRLAGSEIHTHFLYPSLHLSSPMTYMRVIIYKRYNINKSEQDSTLNRLSLSQIIDL